MIRPTGRADLCKVGAFEVGAVNQQPANAGRPHCPEGYFLLTDRRGEGGHAPMIPQIRTLVKPLQVGRATKKRPQRGGSLEYIEQSFRDIQQALVD